MKKKIILFFAALVTGVLIAEGIFRYKGDYLSYNERTGAGGYTSPFAANDMGWTFAYPPYAKQYLKRDEFTDTWTANEDGMKDVNISERKTGERIFVLGDSFAEGVGALPDSAYPRILESLFRERGVSQLQVINGGIGGSDVFFAYQLLKKYFLKYKPDMVILTINSSDVSDCLIRGGFERFKDNGKVRYRDAPWFERFYAHSSLVRVLAHDVFDYDYHFIGKKNYPEKFEEAIHLLATAIDSFSFFCKQEQILYLVVLQPFFTEVQYPESYQMRTLSEYCLDSNIPHIDILSCMQSKSVDSSNCLQFYWQMDGHFNSKGYELVARCVFDFIEEKNWYSEKKEYSSDFP